VNEKTVEIDEEVDQEVENENIDEEIDIAPVAVRTVDKRINLVNEDQENEVTMKRIKSHLRRKKNQN